MSGSNSDQQKVKLKIGYRPYQHEIVESDRSQEDHEEIEDEKYKKRGEEKKILENWRSKRFSTGEGNRNRHIDEGR